MSAAAEQPGLLALAAGFPAATRAQWRERVSAVLARTGTPPDAEPEQALAQQTYDAITVRPLYTAADAAGLPDRGVPGQAPFVRGSRPLSADGAGCDVRARLADPDPVRANAAALADLAGGATSLWLVLGGSGTAVADLAGVLDGVLLDVAPVVVDAGAETPAAAVALLELAAQRGVRSDELAGSLGADPIGLQAVTGSPARLDLLGELAALAPRERYPQLRLATVDACRYADAGASDAQELGIATAVGVSYLRALVDAGAGLDYALAALEFRFALSDDQFAGIAKLRAARQVWARVAELCGGAATAGGQRQHAVTAAAMLTTRDPWVNLLRTTVAGFAAAIGGATAVTVLPFDSAVGEPDEFGRRLARNTQAILHDESSLGRVADAAGGSWYVESLTDALAQRAWQVFTDLERSGGVLAALGDGTVERLIAATRAERDADIAHRRAPITGVSEFAYLDEEGLERRPALAPAGGGPLVAHRYAEGFEALRDRADAAPVRPSVLLAALGPLSEHSGRVRFAQQLFAAGGIEVVIARGSVADIAARAAGTGSRLACLCGTDRAYARDGAELVTALRAGTRAEVWSAGTTELPGVDRRIFAGCDALAALRAAFDALAVPA